jgi:cytochrome b561
MVLAVARLIWWRFDRRPAPIAGMPRLQRVAARAVHLLLQAVILFLAATGIGTLVLSGAGAMLLTGTPGPLPDLWRYQPRLEHWLAARVLLGLLVLHVGAALYHQLVRRDGLMRRMLPWGAPASSRA